MSFPTLVVLFTTMVTHNGVLETQRTYNSDWCPKIIAQRLELIRKDPRAEVDIIYQDSKSLIVNYDATLKAGQNSFERVQLKMQCIE